VIRSAAQGLSEAAAPDDAEAQRACSFITAEIDRLSNVISSLLAFARRAARARACRSARSSTRAPPRCDDLAESGVRVRATPPTCRRCTPTRSRVSGPVGLLANAAEVVPAARIALEARHATAPSSSRSPTRDRRRPELREASSSRSSHPAAWHRSRPRRRAADRRGARRRIASPTVRRRTLRHRLPIADAPRGGVTARILIAPRERHDPRVLIVDDEERMVGVVAAALGAPAGNARLRDGRGCPRRARGTRADAVVTDWKMPQMDGIELLAPARKRPACRDPPHRLRSIPPRSRRCARAHSIT